MGGALTTKSDGEGKGATFIVELPFKPLGVTKWTTSVTTGTDVS